MLLNQKQACGYLKIKPEYFREIVNAGEIGFKVIGKSKRYPIEELDRWQSELTYIGSTKEVKRGGRISPFLPKMVIKDIDALFTPPTRNKLNYTQKDC